jgi:hypothetical protein
MVVVGATRTKPGRSSATRSRRRVSIFYFLTSSLGPGLAFLSTAMDVRTPVHSRHSQYNKRVPKSGPTAPTVRFTEPQLKPILDKFSKHPMASAKSSKSSAGPLHLLKPRPIATNSRVKQDEKYRKDMYLAFVNNALQEKANVSLVYR